MKTSKKSLIMLVAMLLMATSVWAGEVTIVKKLNGTVNNNVGTVTSQVDGTSASCTITVTPANGYYIETVTAEKTVDGSLAQTRRQAPSMDNMLTVTASDPTADPSGVTTWTFEMPNSEYGVEVVANFQQRTNISDATVTLAETEFTYNGEEFSPAVSSVVLGEVTLSASDYDVAYSDNTDAGTATVTVTGKNTYTGTATATFTINQAALNLSVSIEGWTYGDDPNEPSVEGNEGSGDELFSYKVKGADDATYSSEQPVNAGTYIVKADVAETGNYAAGSATAEFIIEKAELLLKVTVDNWTYGDEPNTPLVEGNSGSGTVTITYQGENDDDFSATVPTNAGGYNVKVEVAETANYLSGEAYGEFSIEQADFSEVTIADIEEQTFTGDSIKPAVVVTFKGQPVDALEYEAVYTNNKFVGEATVTLSTKGVNFFFEGDAYPSKTFQIVAAPVAISAEDMTVTYNGQPQAYTAATVAHGSLQVKYATSQDAGAQQTTEAPTHAGVYYVTISQTDENYTSTDATATFTIEAKALTQDMIWSEGEEFVYDGEEQTLNGDIFGLTDGDADLELGTDYTIAYADNTNVGTATVTITGEGNYQGSLTYNFSIVRQLNVSFTDHNWASYYAEENLQIPEGLKAYIVTNIGATAVEVQEIQYIPQHQGVLLNCEDEVPEMLTAAAYEGAAQEFTTNLLKGCSAATAVSTLATDNKNIYVLYNDEFVKTTTGSVPAFRCYLEVSGNLTGSARLDIVPVESETNAIQDARFATNGLQPVYDLTGRKVNTLQKKGFFIVNGRKVVVK